VLELFLIVAGVHFLALLSPGPDFFLIVRTALLHGWRRASGICAGVALANGLFIALAWAGLSAVQPGSMLYTALQWGGCGYLAWLGMRLVRSPGTPVTVQAPGAADALAPGWPQALRMGLINALLNPKNALSYASLFTLLASSPGYLQAICGVWMVCAVLGWDLLVAAAAGHPVVMRRFARHVGRLERATGAVLLALAAGMAINALR